ncbi:MAG: ABC transporter permease [Lachnospiraceae bacterium]|nr:ABC transporter permease [Lachnospiraceae bacterium]
MNHIAHPNLVKFCRKKSAIISLLIFVVILLSVIFLPIILNLDPYTMDYTAIKQAPSKIHILGTDAVGRDMLARLMYGGRLSLFIGITSTVVSAVLGIVFGLLAGYYRNWVEMIIMRLADIFMSFPGMVLILTLVSVVGASLGSVIFVLGVLGWVFPAKLIYGNVISVRNKEYVEAAATMGASDFVIMVKEVLPNSITPLWMNLPFRMSQAILTESALSFLGAGIQAPQASWGNIINAAQDISILQNCPWIWLPAGLLLLVTVFCINLIGEGIRDAVDPKTKL